MPVVVVVAAAAAAAAAVAVVVVVVVVVVADLPVQNGQRWKGCGPALHRAAWMVQLVASWSGVVRAGYRER